jgi:hypothetical protein
MMRAWRLAGPPFLQLQRLPRRIVGGHVAVRWPFAGRSLASADPGRSSALRGTVWDEWSSKLFGQGRAETPQQGDGNGGGGGGDGQGRPPIEPAEHNSELHALLDAGEQSKAREMFDRLLDQGHVDEHDLGRVMQACYSSTEMWKLASRVEEAGVPITSLTFNR